MKKFGPALLLALVVFVAYLPALRNGFVWDDTALILRDPLIRSWRLIPEGFQHFLFTDATASDFYRPIQRLIYTLEYCAFAVRPMPYHFTSITCHIGAAIGLLLMVGELLRTFGVEERTRKNVAFAANLAWALHPVHNAAVDYISGRADPLAAVFGFFALYLVLRGGDELRFGRLLGAAVLFLLSALSKEAGLIFLLIWLGALLLQKKRQAILQWATVSAVVLTVYLSLRLPAEHIPPPHLRAAAPALVRPIVAARAFAEYAQLLALPISLHMDRDVETQPTGFNEASETSAAWRELQTLLGIALFAAMIFTAEKARKKNRALFALLILSAIAYVPVSGLFALNATVAEHWLYLPSAFFFPAAGLILSRLSGRRLPGIFIGAIVAAWICFLGVRTFIRASDWKDQHTFFARTLATGGETARMLINLAGVEMNEGNLASAKQHLLRAFAMEPDQPLAVINLAAVAIKEHEFAAAHSWIDRAVTLPLVEAQAQELRAVLASQEEGKVDLPRLRLATRTGPPNWQIEKRYIRTLDESGATASAIAEVKDVLSREWYRAESWELLSELLEKSGRTREAAVAAARAKDFDVHLGLRPKVL